MAEKKESSEATVRTIRRVTGKDYLAEKQVRIVLEGLRGETSIAALCRREGSGDWGAVVAKCRRDTAAQQLRGSAATEVHGIRATLPGKVRFLGRRQRYLSWTTRC